MSDELCVICGDRPAFGAYGCPQCLERARRLLGEIGDMAQAALDVAQRQAVRGGGGGAGKPGSSLPIDLGAMARYDAVRNALTTWVRLIQEERGIGPESHGDGRTPVIAGTGRAGSGTGDLSGICGWLADHCEWMRHRESVDEFARDIEASARVIRGIAEPGGRHRVIVGMCDCGKTLYAPAGKQTVTCKDCDLNWAVDESRDALRGHLDQQLVTAAEAARLAAWLDTGRTLKQVRALIAAWASRHRITAHSEVLVKHQHRDCPDGCAVHTDRIVTYRFGDIAQLIATTPRRGANSDAQMGA